MIAGWIAAMVL